MGERNDTVHKTHILHGTLCEMLYRMAINMFNRIRNKKIKKLYPDNESFYIDGLLFVISGSELDLYDEKKESII